MIMFVNDRKQHEKKKKVVEDSYQRPKAVEKEEKGR
jgi:hypothetical protein